MYDLYNNSNNTPETLSEKFVVRFPRGMRAEIHKVANRGRRSMNKEIVARLEHSLANFETVQGEVSEFISKSTIAEEDFSSNDKAYAEVILNNQLRQKIAQLSYERKRALLKFL